MVVRQGEGRKLLQVHFLAAVGFEQCGADATQGEALLDGGFAHAEPGGDVRQARAVLNQLAPGFKLIGGMHGEADHVLRQADLRRVGLRRDDLAGNAVVGFHSALRDQRLEGKQAALAGDHFVFAFLGLSND